MRTLILALLFVSVPALAATDDTDQKTLLTPTSEASAPSENLVIERHFSLGLGTGVNQFGGNIGKLYSTSSPVMEVRGEWAFNRLFTARLGADLAKYSFNAAPNGAVDVDTKALQAAGQVHLLSTALSSAGFDPYVSAHAAQVFRTQKFMDHNSIEKDNAFGLGAGIGTNYLPANSHIGVYAEADASQVFFQDRYDQQYLSSGLEDQTGLLYSARVGVKYVF